MAIKKNWTREELILAFNLYCKTPFGRIHTSNPEVISLANLIKRTPSAVAWKLANFASLDTSLEQKGASHASKADSEIYEEFCNDWETLSFESDMLLANYSGKMVEEVAMIDKSTLPKEGKEREAMVRVRVNQNFFRASVLAAYDYKCCITGLPLSEILIASHIIPWSVDQQNRVNPQNGLCLNALHDKAFDNGLLTITPDFKVKLSQKIMNLPNDSSNVDLLKKYNGKSIRLPTRFNPDPSFLTRHNNEFFDKENI